VVNLAVRLCGVAHGSQILVTNRVHGALEDRVEGTSLGTMDFKGLSPPVPVFEIADLR
jgi:class 3 adenylate cyclase